LLVLPFVALDTPHPRTVRVLWKATPFIKINDFQRLKAINIDLDPFVNWIFVIAQVHG